MGYTIGIFVVLLLVSGYHGIPTNEGTVPNKLFYIMLDGFRYDYVDMQPALNLPGFRKFLRNGVRAEWMTPIFPSISYPDWTTLVTGLWSESHGIVGNYMYDGETNEQFLLPDGSTTGQDHWWSAEPIWTTATKAGLKTGIIRWSRCEVPYDNILPEHCEPFDMDEQEPESFTNNTKKALDLLKNGYDMVLLYTPYIDTVGHYDGPETDHMIKAVQFVDEHIRLILSDLADSNLEDRVNIIIVSDHGMKDIYPGTAQHIELDDYLNLDLIETIVDSGAFSNIKTTPGSVDQVFDSLKEIEGIDVYRKEDVPHRFHYSDHKYINDIVIVAKNGYYIQGSRSDKQIPQRLNVSDPEYKELIAAHGFDPLEEKMRAIFFASGPDFKENKIIPAIQNVDVYPLLAHLLNVQALPNNGTMLHVQQSLKNY